MGARRIRVPVFGRPGVSLHPAARPRYYDPAAYALASSGDPYGPFVASFLGRAIEADFERPWIRRGAPGAAGRGAAARVASWRPVGGV